APFGAEWNHPIESALRLGEAPQGGEHVSVEQQRDDQRLVTGIPQRLCRRSRLSEQLRRLGVAAEAESRSSEPEQKPGVNQRSSRPGRESLRYLYQLVGSTVLVGPIERCRFVEQHLDLGRKIAQPMSALSRGAEVRAGILVAAQPVTHQAAASAGARPPLVKLRGHLLDGL